MMGPLLDQDFDDLLLIGSEHTEYASGTENVIQYFFSHINKGVVLIFSYNFLTVLCCCIG